MTHLTVELVPSTCWWSNVRSEVSAKDWNICKAFVRRRSGDHCEVCGGQGPRWPVECHEIWDYDDERHVQTLLGLIALCPACHECKHIGRAFALGYEVRAIDHLCRVNGWSLYDVEAYLETVFEEHARRSTHEWTLDITYLHLHGIYPDIHARRAP